MSDRLKGIVDRMRVAAIDVVLEIGCGHGVAATYICERLDGGRYLAIDRSKTMIEAAIRRNQRFVTAGVARFQIADVTSFDPGTARFDKILAVRVRLFHIDPDRVRRMVKPWLAPGGKLFVEYDEP